MPISFNNIPSNWKMPLYWVEVDPSKAGFPRSRMPSLLIGTMNADGEATPDVPLACGTLNDVRIAAGAGSMLDGMAETFFRNNFAQELWILPVVEADGGQEATGSITVATPPTAAGTIYIYIAGRRVAVGIEADDSSADVAHAIAAAINDDLSMPVVATNTNTDDTVAALECKWKGIEGNDIDVRVNYGGSRAGETMPVGLTLTIANAGKLSGGTGTANLDAAIVNMGDEAYEYVACGFTDTTNFTDLDTEYGFSDIGRWGWMRQLYGHVFGAVRGTGTGNGYSELMLFGPNQNSAVWSLLAFEKECPTPSWQWAAAYAAKAARALVNDPARPLQTLSLDGCLPAPKHQRFTMRQLNDLAGVGMATQRVNGDGVPAVARESTTYQKNLYGQGDDAYELVPTLATLAKVLRNQRQAITSKFPRHKLADDGTRFGPGQAIVTPKIIKAELIAQYRLDEYNGLVENGSAFKANLIVERDSNDPNRLNVLYPPDLVNQLRIFAVLAQFRLQYNRGVDTAIIG